MILSLAIFALWIFYIFGGFKKLMQVFELEPDTAPELSEPRQPAPIASYNPPQIIPPQPVPVVYSSPDPQPAPPVISQAPKLKPYNPPQKTPEREKLENTAAGMLTLAGCMFDVYSYVRSKSDIELMDIIKD